jgi:hypothetical protein
MQASSLSCDTPLAKSAASPVHSHEWYSTEFSDKYGTASAQKLEFMMTFSPSKRPETSDEYDLTCAPVL